MHVVDWKNYYTQRTSIQDAIEFKPKFIGYGGKPDDYYQVSFYCSPNNIIHPNLNSKLKCHHCITKEERQQYADQQRMIKITQ